MKVCCCFYFEILETLTPPSSRHHYPQCGSLFKLSFVVGDQQEALERSDVHLQQLSAEVRRRCRRPLLVIECCCVANIC